MRVYRGREVRINYGDYEGTVISGGVTLEHTDLGISDEQVLELAPKERSALLKDLRDRVTQELGLLQLDEIKAARDFAVSASFVHEMFEEDDDDPPAPRTRRRRRS